MGGSFGGEWGCKLIGSQPHAVSLLFCGGREPSGGRSLGGWLRGWVGCDYSI